MKTNPKLQELVSNSVANALATVSNASKEDKKAPKAKKETSKAKAKKETSKAKASKKEEVTKEVTHQQNVAIVEQVISNREVKYIYPKDVVDTLSRKRWRQQQRNELHKLERNMYRIKDTNSKEFKEAKAKYEAKVAEVLKPAQIA